MLLTEDQQLAAVADGMGGHSSGEVAASMAIAELERRLLNVGIEDGSEHRVHDFLGAAIDAINASIYQRGIADPDLAGMGTTLVVALNLGQRLYYANVGDSRLYLYRAGRLHSLTRDHTLVQELIDSGLFENAEQAKDIGVRSGVLTRCLGVEPAIDIDVGHLDRKPGDLYLLCSDGLSTVCSDARIESILANDELDLGTRADLLVTAALNEGGPDNVSLVLLGD